MDLKIFLRSLVRYISPPQRVIVGVLVFSAILNAFALRHSIDIILPPDSESDNYPRHVLNTKAIVLEHLDKRFKFSYHGHFETYRQKWKWRKRKWAEENYNQNSSLLFSEDFIRARQKHFLVLISFYVGYVIGHMPGALLTERYGDKWILAVALLLIAFYTLITPVIIKHWGVNGLLILRFLMGMSQGLVFPAVSQLMSNWIALNERTWFFAIVSSSGHMAILLVNLLFGFVITNFEWTAIFYFVAAGALLWFIGFIILCFDEPESNPYINETELLYLPHSIPSLRELQSFHSLRRPWLQVLMSPPLWALLLATIQHDWSQSLILTELHDVLQDLKSFTLWPKICLPLLLNWLISLLAQLLSDLLTQKEILSTTEARQLLALIAAFGPRICSNLSNCILCSESYDLNNIINCTISLMGSYYAGVKLSELDTSPTYAAFIMAIAKGLGSIGSVLGYCLEDLAKNSETLQNIRSFFWLIMTMLPSGELQGFDQNISNKN